MVDLRSLGGVAPQKARYFPTRNDPLNCHLGGGWLFGALNEVYGGPGLFKTTLCGELVADMLRAKGCVVVFDREERLNHERLATLGADVVSPQLLYHHNQPYLLTVEYIFQRATEIVWHIRTEDIKAVIRKLLSKKPPKTLLDRYQRRLGMTGKVTAKKVAGALRYADGNKKETFYAHLLCPEDKTDIAIIVDSVTAVPSLTQVAGDKLKSKVPDRVEVQIRQDAVGSDSLGQSARAWSAAFQQCRFLDENVLMLATAQMRMAGFGSITGPFQAAAEPNAHGFYARNRLYVMPNRGGTFIYAHPDGGFAYDADSLTAQQRDACVGRRVRYYVKKTIAHAETSVPAFMIGATGTDRANTVWEYLLDRNILVSAGAGNYQIRKGLQDIEGVEPVPKLKRATFIEESYEDFIDTWAALVRHHVSTRVNL